MTIYKFLRTLRRLCGKYADFDCCGCPVDGNCPYDLYCLGDMSEGKLKQSIRDVKRWARKNPGRKEK